MGALHDGNGGESGGGLPELPPEWGDIIIPDDPSALASEAAVVRRQARRYERSRRWRRRLHLPPPPRRYDEADQTGLGAPLLVMAIAVITTLVSLFAIGWPAQRRNATAGRATPGPVEAGNQVTSAGSGPLASLTLADAAGSKVRLTDTLPAVVLLVDNCTCEDLITATATAAGPDVTVLAIAAGWPSPVPVLVPGDPSRAGRVHRLVDPGGSVRAAIPGLAHTPAPAAALVGLDGTAIRTIPTARSVEDFRGDLHRLTR